MTLRMKMHAMAGLLALAFALLVPGLATADTPSNTQEDFTGAQTANPWLFYNGACLTAGTGTSTSSPGIIPGCQTVLTTYYTQSHNGNTDPYLVGGSSGYLGGTTAPASAASQLPDPAGSGALRFTNGYPYGYNESGAIVSTNSLGTSEGLEITFKTVTYLGNGGGSGKDGADGMSFYLMDACVPLTGLPSSAYPSGCPSATANPLYGSIYPAIGAFGGSLAYTCSNANSPFDGLVGGYIGVGIDEYGNFLNGTSITTSETGTTASGDNTASGGGYQPGRIGLRGAGSISWNALTTAYGTDQSGTMGITMPYYPASLRTTCSNGGVYSASTNSCGPVCTTGVYNSSRNTCDICAAGQTFYQPGNTCNYCSTGTYDAPTNTCTPAYTCASGTVVGATCHSCSSGTYDAPSDTCSPAYSCSSGTFSPLSPTTCNTCTSGTYTASTNTCSPAATCSSGTYNATTGTCSTVCASGYTLNTVGNICDQCATGALNIQGSGAAYCDNICPSGSTYEPGGQGVYPNVCYKCSTGVAPRQLGGAGTAVSCPTGTLSTVAEKTPSTKTPTTATPVATLKVLSNKPVKTLTSVAATAVLKTAAPTTVSPLTGAPYYLSAVQNTCKTGNLYNYSNPNAPVSAGPAVSGASYNPVGIQDYTAIDPAFNVLSTVKIAAESAPTRIANPADTTAAVPIFYDLRISADGKLTFAYSLSGSAYTSVIKDKPITDSNGPLPTAFRFGFAGSSGGSTNVHEILCFKATPVKEAGGSTAVDEKQSSKIQSLTQAYFGFYNPSPTVWTGNVTANKLIDTGGVVTVNATPEWDAACKLTGGSCTTGATATVMNPASRVIYTHNGSTTAPSGVQFTWSALSAAQQTALGASTLVDYLRGDRHNEIPNGSSLYRTRDGILSDIIDSSPVWVGPPQSPYTARWTDRLYPGNSVPEGTGQTYLSFVSAEQQRLNAVYVGANDGMLHAFRSGSFDNGNNFQGSLNDGAEIMAYMPNAVTLSIHNTGTDDVSEALDFPGSHYGHNFFVDSTPATGDLFYNNAWHTWLAGGLGAGGKAIYVLDITDPTATATSFSQGNAANVVIGEWNPSTISCPSTGGSSCGTNLGNTYGTPLIRRLHNGQWAVIFGNGIGSGTGDAGVFIMTINPTTHASVFYYLTTGAAGANGIEYVTSADLDGDHITDYLYAGDLQGNVWRFDLTSTTASDWHVSGTALFKADVGQPITSQVAVAAVPVTGGAPRIMVSFGTGQRVQLTNTTPTTYSMGAQALYGVWDWDLAAWNSHSTSTYQASSTVPDGVPPVTKANLTAQTFTFNSSTGIVEGTANSVCWQGLTVCSGGSTGNAKFGWYAVLPGGNSSTGTEQVIYNPTLAGAVFLVNSTTPGNNTPTSCSSTLDTGITYAVNVGTGATFANIFPQYHDTLAAGVQTNATGTPFVVATSEGTSALIYQTVSGTPGSTQFAPPPNTRANRLTWIELR